MTLSYFIKMVLMMRPGTEGPHLKMSAEKKKKKNSFLSNSWLKYDYKTVLHLCIHSLFSYRLLKIHQLIKINVTVRQQRNETVIVR